MPDYECNACHRTFPLPGRIEATVKEQDSLHDFRQIAPTKKEKYTTVIKYCCPFCESVDLKEVREK